MRNIGVGVIGTGFMGKAHSFAYRAVAGIFPGSLRPVLQSVADINGEAAEQAAKQFGFHRWRTDWRALVEDPDIEVVSITTPNADAAKDMMDAAEAAGVVTQVGYNYIKNPMLKLARSMVAAGELGEITAFRGIHAEDYMADPETPYNWRVDASGGAGAIADIGSHIIGMARFLLGPISHIDADLETVVKSRPITAGSSERRTVEVDDIARLTVRFERGCKGTIEANWVATGRKMQLGFELTGAKGSLFYTQERLNELLHYRTKGDPRHSGYARIEAGPAHHPYGLFCVAPGHQLGFNDLKTIEVAEFLEAIAGGERRGPDFREAWEIQKIIDTAVRSSKLGTWQAIE